MPVSSHRTRLAALVVALLPVGLLAQPAAATTGTGPTGTMLVAHRGSSLNAPENTMPAFDRAVAEHADRMALDVHLTKDGVPVVIHDTKLGRVTDVEKRFPGRSPWMVGDFTMAEIRTLDAGSWFGHGAYAGTHLSSLEEVMTRLGPSKTGLSIEVKAPSLYGGAGGIGAAVMNVVARHPEWISTADEEQPRLVIESFDWGFLDDLHAMYPTVPLVLLSPGSVSADDLAAHPFVKELDVAWRSLDDATLSLARDHGLKVDVWTANDAGSLRSLVAKKLDLITTDATETLSGLLTGAGLTWTGVSWPAASTQRVTFSAPTSAVIGEHARVRITALDASEHPLTWQKATLQRLASGTWRDVATAATDGTGVLSLQPKVSDGLVLRAVSGRAVSRVVTVSTHLPAVAAPSGLPAPSVRLAAQGRRATPGARATVSRLSTAAWRTMAGRSYRSGCPVTRDALRRVSTTYWGFDGYRHRGSVVVARRAATPLARVLGRLYAEHLPLRSLRRVEELGSYRTAVGRGLAGDATFGFACQPMAGDRAAYGSHSRGLVVSVNPWENPTAPGAPDRAWLDRTRSLSYVHRTGNPVVAAFAANGFSWRGGLGRYGEFRYVR